MTIRGRSGDDPGTTLGRLIGDPVTAGRRRTFAQFLNKKG